MDRAYSYETLLLAGLYISVATYKGCSRVENNVTFMRCIF